MKILIYVGLICMLLNGNPGLAQSKAERRQQREQMVRDSVEARTYKILVSVAYPFAGNSVPLSSYFGLEVRGDSLNSYLPYFGRAYSIPYGGGEGLNFESAISDYRQEARSDGGYRISFNTRTREDYYTYLLDIYPNGSVRIHVTMQQRQAIDFQGDVVFE